MAWSRPARLGGLFVIIAEGWAWVPSLGKSGPSDDEGFSGSLEAHGVYDFVCHTLSQSTEQDEESSSTDDQNPDEAPDDYVSGFSFRFEDPDLIKHSGFALVVMQQISLVNMTKQLVEPRLPKE